jgi:hypothetical protein
LRAPRRNLRRSEREREIMKANKNFIVNCFLCVKGREEEEIRRRRRRKKPYNKRGRHPAYFFFRNSINHLKLLFLFFFVICLTQRHHDFERTTTTQFTLILHSFGSFFQTKKLLFGIFKCNY